MKLTGKLEEKAKLAETKEELKNIIAEAGMELTDDELDQVAGGKILEKIEFKRYIAAEVVDSLCKSI